MITHIEFDLVWTINGRLKSGRRWGYDGIGLRQLARTLWTIKAWRAIWQRPGVCLRCDGTRRDPRSARGGACPSCTKAGWKR